MNKPDKDWGLGTEDTGMKGRTSLGHIFGQVSLVFFLCSPWPQWQTYLFARLSLSRLLGSLCVPCVCLCVCVLVRVSHSMQIATGRRPDMTGISLPWRTVARSSLMLLKLSMSIRI